MRILDKYIVKRIAIGYIFVLMVFIGLYFVIDSFSNLSDILKNKPPLEIIAQYYLYSLPLIILRVSPLALLISTLYTFGELNRNNEIITIRASGMSIFKIAVPVILFSLLVSASVFFLQEKTLINSQKKTEDIKIKFINDDNPASAVERNLAFNSGNMIVFASRFIPKEKKLENVIIFEKNKEGKIIKQVMCQSIIYEYKFWIGRDIVEYSFDHRGKITNKPMARRTKKISLVEKPRELMLKKSILLQFSSLNNLRKEIDNLKEIGAGNRLSNLIIDYYQKMAEPFSHFFLIIGILPLALEIKKRKVALSALGVGFIFGFIYYALSSFSIALGKSGLILPIFAAWLAPLFFLTIGITGLLLIR